MYIFRRPWRRQWLKRHVRTTPPALTIDGSGATATSSSASSIAAAITTTLTNDIILAFVHLEKPSGGGVTVSGVSGGGLTWALRKQNAFTLSGGGPQDIEIWWAAASSAVVAQTITATFTGAADACSLQLIAVHGCSNLASPWDSNVSVPAAGTINAAGNPSATISTSSASTLALGFWGTAAPNSRTAGSGFTALYATTGSAGSLWSYTNSEYQVFSSTQTSVTVAFAGSGSIAGGFVFDVLSAAAPLINVPVTGAGSLFAPGVFADGISEPFGGVGSLFAAGSTSATWSTTGAMGGIGSTFAPGASGISVSLTGPGSGSLFAPGAFTTAITSGALSGSGSLFSAGIFAPPLVGSGSPFAAAGEVSTSVALPSMTTGSPFAAASSLGFSWSLPNGAGSLFAPGVFADGISEPFGGVGSLFAAGLFPGALFGVGSVFNAGDPAASWSTTGEMGGINSPFSAGTFTVTTSVGLNIPAIGVGSLFSGGAFVPSLISGALSGSGSLYSSGIFRPSIAALLAGGGSPFAPGAFIPGLIEPFTGIGSTFSPGVFGHADTLGLTGNGSVYSAGAFVGSIATAAMAGVGELFAAGAFSVITNNSINIQLPGAGSLFGPGIFAPKITDHILGVGTPVAVGPLAEIDMSALSGVGSPASSGVLPFRAVVSGSVGSVYGAGAFGFAIVGVFPGIGSRYSASPPTYGSSRVVAIIGTGSPFAVGAFSTSDLEAIANAGSPFAPGAFGKGILPGLNGQGTRYAAYMSALGLTVPLSGIGSLYAPGAFLASSLMSASLPGSGAHFAIGAFELGGSNFAEIVGSGSPFAGGLWSTSDLEAIKNTGAQFASGLFGRGGVSLIIPGVGSPYAAGIPLVVASLDPGIGSLYATGAFSDGIITPIPGVGALYSAGAFGVLSFSQTLGQFVLATTMDAPLVMAIGTATPSPATQAYYVRGQQAVITATFTNPTTKAGMVPDDLILRIQPPVGAEIDIPTGFGQPSTGVYTYSQELTQSGVWRYRWEASGSFFAACEGALYVPVSPFVAD